MVRGVRNGDGGGAVLLAFTQFCNCSMCGYDSFESRQEALLYEVHRVMLSRRPRTVVHNGSSHHARRYARTLVQRHIARPRAPAPARKHALIHTRTERRVDAHARTPVRTMAMDPQSAPPWPRVIVWFKGSAVFGSFQCMRPSP